MTEFIRNRTAGKLLEVFNGGKPLPPFKPCVIENDAMHLTEVVLEDVGYVAVPVFKGVHHTVDWLLAMDDGRIVGVQVWALKEDKKL